MPADSPGMGAPERQRWSSCWRACTYTLIKAAAEACHPLAVEEHRIDTHIQTHSQREWYGFPWEVSYVTQVTFQTGVLEE